jgi:adenine-specific DNA-methyltransferase
MTRNNPSGQERLQLITPDEGSTNVEKYKFEPIKGYPMLNWRGKRPFTSTQYYPAQLKEVHGEEVDGWRNKIFWGDNLQVMSHLLKHFRGKVDLIYIDPPFDSNADYKKRIRLKSGLAEGDQSSFEEKQYGDIWNNDEYLQFLYERLVLLRELLAVSGSIYVHCDANRGHYIKCLMDEVFGAGNFRNEIIWKRTSARADSSTYNHVHDTVFFYTKSETFTWNKQFTQHSDAYLKSKYSSVDKDGRKYRLDNITSPNPRPNMTYEWKGFAPPANGWRYSQEKMAELDAVGRIWYPDEKIKRPQLIRFLDESEGRPLDSVWMDIFPVNSQGSDRLNYPTQKPVALLDRIIKASSDTGSLVFDCFMGSGTTQDAAMRLGRRFIGADINLGAIQTTAKRLIGVADDLRQKALDGEVDHYTGFELYNVNHYDIFRNPIQAKDLLMEALEVQKLEFSTVFDGEKDGRMVKIMPVNRIATRADLTELIAGFDYKAWDRKQNENPNRPVEKISLVCMGHEPDLAAQLQLAAKPFKIDVEVVDILRDKADLEFKRDSEAKVAIKKGELVITKFYPMNLLQKLSIQKESVADWTELVDSVLIDWNYDGAVLQPTVVDIPSTGGLVKGAYKVPDDAGTIRVKITDLLSESWEGSVSRGD